MTGERLRERIDRWRGRSRAADAAPSADKDEEHRRYEQTLERSGDRDEDTGALAPDHAEMRHDTPPSAEQTAG